MAQRTACEPRVLLVLPATILRDLQDRSTWDLSFPICKKELVGSPLVLALQASMGWTSQAPHRS